MRSWKYAHLYTSAGIRLQSSDPLLIDWGLAQLRNQDPSGRANAFELHTGQKYEFIWHPKDVKVSYLALWLLSQLLLLGWEPFQVEDEIGEYGWFLRRMDDQ